MKTRYPFYLFVFLMFLACSAEEADDGQTDTPDIPFPTGGAPESATLVFPENNTECTSGTVLNDQESTIVFEWEASANTDSYEVNIKDLSTNTEAVVQSATNTASITLLRGVGYEWSVVSLRDNVQESATSATWRFYNEGEGVQFYAPFAAQAVNPARGATLDASGVIDLVWEASDVDGDIVSFEVYMDVVEAVTTRIGTVTVPNLNVNVVSGNYYWRVKTIDAAGNASWSEVFDFVVP